MTQKLYTQAERENYEERAAIMEYHGNLSRQSAEYYALRRVLEWRKRYSSINAQRRGTHDSVYDHH